MGRLFQDPLSAEGCVWEGIERAGVKPTTCCLDCLGHSWEGPRIVMSVPLAVCAYIKAVGAWFHFNDKKIEVLNPDFMMGKHSITLRFMTVTGPCCCPLDAYEAYAASAGCLLLRKALGRHPSIQPSA